MNDLTYFEENCHAGISKLWDALAVGDLDLSAPPIDVFTRSVTAINRGRWYQRLAKTQARYGILDKVCLYPCPLCSNWTIDEWYWRSSPIDSLHKELAIVSVADIEAARALYRDIMVLDECHYVSATDSYTNKNQGNNFIVTGSHGRCKECSK
jgi:hypothetical protein